MSGPRNLGQTLDGSFEKGCFDPAFFKIIFAVPSRKALQCMTPKKTCLPGINTDILDNLSEPFKSKPLNLSVDWEKLCRGKGKNNEDIDCWGSKKTIITERKYKLETDKGLTNSVLEQLCKIEGTGISNANEIPKQLCLNILARFKTVVKTIGERNMQLR